MEFSLKGKVAVVTGCSRGIGWATALGFAHAGAEVVLASRKIEDLEKTIGKLDDVLGPIPKAGELQKEMESIEQDLKEGIKEIEAIAAEAITKPIDSVIPPVPDKKVIPRAKKAIK